MTPDRAVIVGAARDSIAAGSKSFAFASKLFDRKTREHAWLLYAWCRRCDDLADGQVMGHDMSAVEDPKARLDYIRTETDRTLAGETDVEPAFAAIAIVSKECQLPRQYIDDIIDGFALDAREWRPRTENDLYQYCYHVAGAVGRLMAIVMGVDANDTDTLDRATDLGLAFQLANIARDLEEDDAADRCYLPQEWLAEMDIPPGEHMKPPFRSRLCHLTQRLCDAAELYEASARVGARKLPYRSRWAVLSAAGIYGDIAREVKSRGEHAWDHRVVTTKADKLKWVGKSALSALSEPRPISREMLWSHTTA